MNHLRSMRSLLACALVATLGHATPAVASEPDFTVVFPAGIACEFEVHLDGFGGKGHFSEFTDQNGNLVRTLDVVTQLVLQFTNTATDAMFSIRLNGSIAQTSDYKPDGSYTLTTTGHRLVILFPTDSPPGPSTTLYTGRAVYTVEPVDVYTLQSSSGRQLDVCAAIS